MKSIYALLGLCLFSLLTIDCVVWRNLPGEIRPYSKLVSIQRPGQSNGEQNCCHKDLQLVDPSYKGQEEYGYYVPAKQTSVASIIVSNDSGQLIACRYQVTVSIQEEIVSKKYLCIPTSPRAFDLNTLKEVGRLSVKIHSNSPIPFEDFVDYLLRHPPDQAQFVRYTHSEKIWEQTGTDSTPQFYCQYYFILYKSKILHSPEDLRLWAQN